MAKDFRNQALDCNIEGYKIQHVLWEVGNTIMPENLNYIYMSCEINPIIKIMNEEVADGLFLLLDHWEKMNLYGKIFDKQRCTENYE